MKLQDNMNRIIKFRSFVYSMKKMFHWGSDLIRIHHDLSWDSLTEGSFNNKDSVLMQFTGLHDSEGKEIYEGDILEYKFKELNFNYKVINEKGCFWLIATGNGNIKESLIIKKSALYEVNLSSFTIIGNIYENHNLIS